MKKDIYVSLFSDNQETAKESLNKIEELSKLSNKDKVNQFFKIILKNYDSHDTANIKITIRALNKCFYQGIKIEFIKKYGALLLQNIINKEGYVRMITFSVMQTFRLNLLFGILHGKTSSNKEIQNLFNYYIDFYIKLTKLYEQTKDKKIKASILSCIKTVHCPSYYELISMTPHIKIYEKFQYIIFDKRG